MSSILDSLGRAFRKIKFEGKKHSPEILVITGLTGTVGAMVLCGIESIKAKEIVEEGKKEIEEVHEKSSELTEKETQKELTKAYLKTGGKLALNYAPAILTEVGSITLVLCGTKIFKNRNAALATSLAASLAEFKEYRDRVIEKFGENGKELDSDLRHGFKEIEVKEEVTDENGKKKTVKKKLKVADKEVDGEYTRIFYADTSNYYDRDPVYNRVFLRARQNYFNDLLKARDTGDNNTGYVFLNEVLTSLGFTTTRAGQEVGWIFNPNNSNGDNYIDFRIVPVDVIKLPDGTKRIVKLNEDTKDCGYMLDFNVDGSILNSVNWTDQKGALLNG